MTKISGIYVEIRGDATQLKKELKEARQLVTEQAQGMSNALNNALSPAQLKNSINGLTRNLNTLSNASKLTGKEFGNLGVDLGHLRRLTGLTETQLQSLQTKMLQTSAAQAQERALRGVARAANLTTAEIRQLGTQMGVSRSGINGVIGVSKNAGTAMGFLTGAAQTALGVFSGMAMVQLTAQLAELPGAIIEAGLAFDSLERSMYAVTGSASAATETLEWLRKESNRLGQNFYNIAPEFKNIAAAARGTAMEGEEVRKLFTAITGASTALGLSMDDTHGTLRALQQMMSKGKIQAEELRGQLGERLPGALNMMADGLGVTTAQLNKMMEDGKLLADEALPKLTIQINKMYKAAAEKAALESGRSAVNRLSQAWTDLKTNLFDAEAFVWATNKVTGLINAINGVVVAKDAASRLADLEAELAPKLERRGEITQKYGVGAAHRNEFKVLNGQIEELQRQIRRTKEEIQWMTDPARDGFMGMAKGMENAASRGSVYAQEVERGREALAKYIQTAKEKARADYEAAVKYANSAEEQARALKVYQDTIAAIDSRGARGGGSSLAKAQAKAHEKMLADGKKAAEALDKYWQDYEDARVKAVADGVAERAKAQEKDLKLVTEFAEKYKEIVLGETEFKKAQIDAQADAYRKAGADEIAVAQWVAAEKLKVSRDWQDGATRALQDYTDSATNAAQNVEDVMTMAFEGLEDVVVEFVKTGKLEFADLVTSINAEIARLAFRGMAQEGYNWLGGLLSAGMSAFSGGGSAVSSAAGTAGVAGTLSSMFSRNANGGVYDSPSLSAYSGGVYHTPQMFAFARGAGIFAEAGPEAIMPLRRGPDGVLGVKADGGNSEMTELLRELVTAARNQRGTKVVNAIGKGAIANELSGSEGEQVIFNHIRRNPSAVRRMLGLS